MAQRSGERNGAATRKSLAAQLLELSNPTPKDFDPENSLAALDGLVMDRLEPEDLPSKSSQTRAVEERRPMRGEPLLGPKYSGRTISRSKLDQASWSDGSSSIDEEDDASMESPDDARQRAADALAAQLEAQVDSFDHSDDEHTSTFAVDAVSDSDSEGAQEEEEAADAAVTEAQALRGVRASMHQDNDRATAAKVQRNMWDSFLDLRIQLQPLLDAAAQMPAPDMLQLLFQEPAHSSTALVDCVKDTQHTTKALLSDLMLLQDQLIDQNDAVQSAIRPKKRKFAEMTPTADSEDIWSTVADSWESMRGWVSDTLDEWSAKALFASGINVSKLKTLNQSVSKQVDEILVSQRSRLLSRAQIRRAASSQLASTGSQDTETQDPELYDDGDFYRAILKELVEMGVQDTSDPVALTRQYLKVRDAAGKKKHRPGVDRRASKGRKLKFTEHEKLLSFMAPEISRHPAHSTVAAEQLSLSLFGKRSVFTL